jgi:hypothetical protein
MSARRGRGSLDPETLCLGLALQRAIMPADQAHDRCMEGPPPKPINTPFHPGTERTRVDHPLTHAFDEERKEDLFGKMTFFQTDVV